MFLSWVHDGKKKTLVIHQSILKTNYSSNIPFPMANQIEGTQTATKDKAIIHFFFSLKTKSHAPSIMQLQIKDFLLISASVDFSRFVL